MTYKVKYKSFPSKRSIYTFFFSKIIKGLFMLLDFFLLTCIFISLLVNGIRRKIISSSYLQEESKYVPNHTESYLHLGFLKSFLHYTYLTKRWILALEQSRIATKIGCFQNGFIKVSCPPMH